MSWALSSLIPTFVTNLFITSQQDNSDQLFERFLYKEGLQYDPIYGAIVLALPYLMAQQHTKDRQYYIKNGTWIKLRISDNSDISFDPPGFGQGIGRTVSGHSREELCLLRKHLVKALKWTFKNQDQHAVDAIKVIFFYTIKGLKELEASYGPETNGKPLEVSIDNKKVKLTGQVEEQNQTNRCLEQDRILIESALQNPDEALTIIDKEDEKLFELRNLTQKIYTQEKQNEPIDQKIEDLYAQKIRALWPSQTLAAIANLFKTKQSSLSDPLTAIQTLIKGNPVEFMQIKKEMHELTVKAIADSSKSKQQ
ncbi:hypothetical protein PNK_2153 [Candidatus Protochlamydia naegleriophila]|uniref:Uncharacterized protein n=1 Tax=Candidatus Protochlamydia naegleriophila TaxID=389348 RepID=A0A0U5CRX5_9BACT|nr:hypothetical protein [Candidatus Protochlamydia naegleriophila]CUI17756.1 hypothetical protein PNK_2153 [Candidatus Protochlamydia naegleriophila]